MYFSQKWVSIGRLDALLAKTLSAMDKHGMADQKEVKTVKRGCPKKENCANDVCSVSNQPEVRQQARH